MTLVTPIHRSLRGVEPGEPMEVPEKFARILIVAKRVKRMPPPKPKGKRTYERRDMQAVESKADAPTTSVETKADPVEETKDEAAS